jgi:hypothetical protein
MPVDTKNRAVVKNAVIFVLLVALTIITYKYIVLSGKFNTRQSETSNNAAVSHNMVFEEGDENSYVVKSKDDEFRILFVYNDQGLKLFGLRDYLSGKEIAFNFLAEGALTSYFYTDDQYSVWTNVASAEILSRRELYKGFEVIYELLPDGIIKTTKKEYADE